MTAIQKQVIAIFVDKSSQQWHVFATSTAEQFLALGTRAGGVEVELEWSGQLGSGGDRPSK